MWDVSKEHKRGGGGAGENLNCSLKNDEPEATWQLMAGILVSFIG